MGTDCCGWDGVTYDTMTGHVIAVDLSCSGLEGLIQYHPFLSSPSPAAQPRFQQFRWLRNFIQVWWLCKHDASQPHSVLVHW